MLSDYCKLCRWNEKYKIAFCSNKAYAGPPTCADFYSFFVLGNELPLIKNEADAVYISKLLEHTVKVIQGFSVRNDLGFNKKNAEKLIPFVKKHEREIAENILKNIKYPDMQSPPFAEAHATCAIEYLMKKISRGDFPHDFLVGEEQFGSEELIVPNPS
ncbi:MAG: hypothetical protein NTU57_05350 [Candidatus Aenigmarchaeota archaeon]|nr:hypothetical protein [Candidatus Aenigmarchaeota archaeon]